MLDSASLLPLIIALPLAGFLINGLAGLLFESYRSRKTLIGTIGTTAAFIPFLLSVWVFLGMSPDSDPIRYHFLNWISAGDFVSDIAWRADQISILWMLFVTGIGSLIHLY